jgi:glycosyltransferase involved in cell wall biosynthesis
MRVLHVTQGYWPALGGTELLIQRVSEELVHRFGDDVTVFTTNCYNGEGFFDPSLPRMPAGWEEINGVRIRRFEVRSRISQCARRVPALAYRLRLPLNQYLRALSSGPVISGLGDAIRQDPADVIAASSFPLLHMFAAARAACATGRPCVLHGGLHPDDRWGFDRSMIYRAIRRGIYIANTRFEADYVISRGALPERVFVAGVGVDADGFTGILPADARRQFGLADGPVVGFIGQLGGHKGVDTLLDAMPMVWRRIPQAQLLIAGGRTMFTSDVEAAVDQLPATWRQRVRMHLDFPPEQKARLFATVDVLAYPSGYESFGIAFLEAWAAGKPVIGCRRGAIPTVVEEGVNGLLVDYRAEGQLAAAIVRLLKDPETARRFGEAGRRKVLSRYTWPKIAERFRMIYRVAVGLPTGRTGRASEPTPA